MVTAAFIGQLKNNTFNSLSGWVATSATTMTSWGRVVVPHGTLWAKATKRSSLTGEQVR